MNDIFDSSEEIKQIESFLQERREKLKKMENYAKSYVNFRSENGLDNFQTLLKIRTYLADYSRIFESDLAFTYANMGHFQKSRKNMEETEACYEHAVQCFRGLFLRDAQNQWKNLVWSYELLQSFYEEFQLYGKLRQLRKRILADSKSMPEAAKKELEHLLQALRKYLPEESEVLITPKDVTGKEKGAEWKEKGEACLAKEDTVSAKPYLWKAAELYEELSECEPEIYGGEALELYLDLAVLCEKEFLFYPFLYVVTKFTDTCRWLSDKNSRAADCVMLSFCQKLVHKDGILFRSAAEIPHGVYEELLHFALHKGSGSVFSRLTTGQLYCCLGKSYQRTVFRDDFAPKAEAAFLNAISTFKELMETDDSFEFRYLWDAGCLLATVYSDREQKLKTLDSMKRLVEEKMKTEEHAFAPYLAWYYYELGCHSLYGWGGYVEAFSKARDLFHELLSSESYTDAEQKEFLSCMNEMSEIERDVSLSYMCP